MLHCVPHFLIVPNPRRYISTLCKRINKNSDNMIIVKEFKTDESGVFHQIKRCVLEHINGLLVDTVMWNCLKDIRLNLKTIR